MKNFNGKLTLNDAAIASGNAFLVGELEKLDPLLREPLTSYTYARDIEIESGGGWVDFISNHNVDFGVSGGNIDSINDIANTIHHIQASFSKDLSPTIPVMEMLSVKWLDLQKNLVTGRSLESVLQDGVMLVWNKILDQACYKGFDKVGTTGLLNNPLVAPVAVANGAGGGTQWSTKTQDEILDDINQAIYDAWAASEFDMSAIPNQILIDPENYSHMVSPLAIGNTPLAVSTLKYVMDNNAAKLQGVNLNIFPCRWCIGAGVAGVNRMIAYRNEKRFVNLPVPFELSRIMTQFNTGTMSYDTPYAGNVGSVRVHYVEPIVYRDGI